MTTLSMPVIVAESNGLFQLMARWLTTAVLATLTTAALFYIMQQLIATDYQEPIETLPLPVSEIFKEDDVIDIEYEDVPEQIEVVPPPETMEIKLSVDTTPHDGTDLGIEFVPVDEDDLGYGNPFGNHVVPLAKVSPKYPLYPLQRGIEGYVVVRFDVSAIGFTENIQVLTSVPEGTFDRSAIRAVEKWRYKTPEVDGNPQGQRNITEKISFTLQK